MKKRILSMLLTIAMILPMFTVFAPVSASAASSSSFQQATSSDEQYKDGIYYTIDKHVIYTGNDQYSMDISISSTTTLTERPKSITSAENGHITVKTAGYYLIELWGGEGANGGSKTNVLGVERLGGLGGTGGYVYAKIWLEAGQTLAYSIGTNGRQSEINNDGMGGANGDGGEHGDDGTYTVGGGGGYSALYLFDEGEFDESWVSSGSFNIPETARVSRYIMIAAGGGGGGAHNGMSALYENGTTSTGIIRRANGGAGGSAANGISVTLNSGTIPGYVFSGRNGQSSNSSTAHVGRGGSNVPGSIVSTYYQYSWGADDEYFAEPGPNDWAGTNTWKWKDYYVDAETPVYNYKVEPGAGGLGNLRGGGGGAGYCGGSGGIMYELLIPNNVGGGGGGSSFLAQAVNDRSVQFLRSGSGDNVLDTETAELLSGASNCPSRIGGAIAITYLGGDVTVLDTSFLESIDVTGSISKYFDITYLSSNYGEVSFDNGTGEFAISGANISPWTLTTAGEKAITNVHMVLTPKEGFAGGNNVPLFVADTFKLTFVNEKGEDDEIIPEEKPTTDYVNVALSFIITTNSIMISVEQIREFALTELYKDEYSDAIASLSGKWQYDFLDSLTGYEIYTGKDGAIAGNEVSAAITPEAPTEDGQTANNYYSVCIKATPKNIGSYASIGPQNTEENQVFYGIACIAVASSQIIEVEGGYNIIANKYLTYNGTAYLFEEEVSQRLNGQIGDSLTYYYEDGVSHDDFVAPADGYYLLQAWGAKGGRGGTATAIAKYSWSSANYRYGYGSSGGDGAYLYGYVYLDAGDTLSFTLGEAGTNASNVTRSYTTEGTGTDIAASASGGTGGSYSAIKLTKADGSYSNYLLIAGGGGGGGGGGAVSTCTGASAPEGDATSTGGSGLNMRSSTTSPSGTLLSSMSSYSGLNGTAGSASTSGINSASGGTGRAAGSSYANATYFNAIANSATVDADELVLTNLIDTLLDTTSATDGMVSETAYNESTSYGSAVQVTSIITSTEMDTLRNLQGLNVEGTVSQYFDVADVQMQINDLDGTFTATKTVSGDITTVVYKKGGTVYYQFSYTLTTDADGNTVYRVTDAIYAPAFVEDITNGTGKGYTAKSGFSLIITLSPKDGFLGGNDVPVLKDGTQALVSINDGEPYTLDANPAVDYANVAIDYDISSPFTVVNKTITYGEGVATGELYDFTMVWPTGADAWKADFVELVTPSDSEVLSPTETTTYPLTVSILPKTTPPEKAVVVGEASGISVTRNATVYVNYPVTYTLTNTTYEGEKLALCKNEFNTVLAPAKGYTLPTSVEVLVNGTAISGFTYDAASGALSIQADAVTGPIEIIAVGNELTYTIYYYYYTEIVDPSAAPAPETAAQKGITANAAIDYTLFDSINADLADKTAEGYEYVWEWDTDDGDQPTVMPAKNITATGSYQKIQYPLTISYVDADGNAVHESYGTYVEFGATFSVVSPTVDGMIADTVSALGGTVGNDPFVVSGTMGTGAITVTVTYRASSNELTVLYVYPNGSTAAEKHQAAYDVGATYSVTSPTLTGYTPDTAVVSGTMDDDGETVVVTYIPNRYEVTLHYQYPAGTHPDYTNGSGEFVDASGFNTTGATMDGLSSITVEYDNIYGYNAATDEYGMPTPQVSGYTFVGWYLLDDEGGFGAQVTESELVRITESTTLYAKWEATPYTLTVTYEFINDDVYSVDLDLFFTSDAFVKVEEVTDGTKVIKVIYSSQHEGFYENEEYAVIIPTIVGYTTYVDYGISTESKLDIVDGTTTLIGTMPGMNHIVYVTYEINTYTVRFADSVDPEVENTGSITYPSYTTVDRVGFKTEWSTQELKHNVKPEYTDTPSHATDAYTFEFSRWESSTTGDAYSSDFPAATEDVTYVACYTAYENVALVYNTGGSLYRTYYILDESDVYTKVSEALTTALGLSGSSSAPIRIALRRNSDLPQEMDISGNTLSVYSSSSTRYINLDLNGITLKSDRTVIDNKEYLYITDSAGTGGILAQAEGDIIAVQGSVSNMYIYVGGLSTSSLSPVKITAISSSGTAKGVAAASGYYHNVYVYEGSAVEASSDSGIAYGVYQPYSSSSYYTRIYGTVKADSQTAEAYGIYSNSSIYLYTGADIQASSSTADAYGTWNKYYVSASTAGAKISAISDEGNAYGVYTTSRTYLSAAASAEDTNETTVTATSYGEDKTAMAIYGYIYSAICANAIATAPNGTAIGIRSYSVYSSYSIGSSSIDYTVSATGKEAIGIDYTATSSSVTVYANVIAEGSESATAVRTKYTTAMYGSASASSAAGTATAMTNTGTTTLYAGASVSAATESGTAYAFSGGIAAAGSSSAIAATVSASATTGTAYGFYNTNLSGSYFNISTPVAVTATEGDAYGLYWNKTASCTYNSYAKTDVSTESGNAYGLYCDMPESTSSYTTAVSGTLNVTSGSGKAYGVYYTGDKALTVSGKVTAEAPEVYGVYYNGAGTATVSGTVTANGNNAYGIYASGTSSLSVTGTVNSTGTTVYGVCASSGTVTVNGKVNATGNNAYGIHACGTVKLSASSSSSKITVSSPVSTETDDGEGSGSEDPDPEPPATEGTLYGIYLDVDATLTNTVGASITVSAEQGVGYGIYNAGTINGMAFIITVTAPYQTYGVANIGTLSSTSSTLKITATSTLSTAYGLYNLGGTVGGTALEESIGYGVIAGITESADEASYGIYSEGGTVYVRGTNLYFKGSTNDNALYGTDIVVYDGYVEYTQQAGETNEGYNRLILLEYRIQFVEMTFAGDIYQTTEFYYDVEGKIYHYDESANVVVDAVPTLTLTETGYTHQWEAYDFVPPTDGEIKTVVSIYVINQYTITFEANGGEDVAPLTEDYKSAITAPDASRVGHTFVGWFSDAELTVEYVFTTMPAEDLTLYAKWQINQYTITFVTNGGTAVEPITQDYDTAITSPTTELTGYTFVGWCKDASLTEIYTITTMPGEDITLYAKWSVNQYTITFVTNGGTAVEPITQDYGSVVAPPTAPTLTGYKFVAWYADEELTVEYAFTTMPAENISVYAKWETGRFTVSFYVTKDDESPIEEITDFYGASFVLPTVTRNGYTFASWYDMATGLEYDFGDTPTIPGEDINLYAEWTLVTYTAVINRFEQYEVNFYRNYTTSETTLISSQTVTADSLQSVSIPSNPMRSQYIFLGWFTERTPSSSSSAYLHGTLSQFDGDGDGVVNFYAGWFYLSTSSSSSYYYSSSYSSIVSYNSYTIGNAASVSIDETYAYRDFIYYIAPEDGTYTLKFLNYKSSYTSSHASRYQKFVNVKVRDADGSLSLNTSYVCAVKTSTADSNYTTVTVNANAGDLILISAYRYDSSNSGPSYDTSVYFKITETPAINTIPLCNTIGYYTYNVESDIVDLPTLTEENFKGWSWMVDGTLSGTVIAQLTPELLDGRIAEWSDPDNPEILYLYSVISEDTSQWTVYIESGRHLKEFYTTLSVVTIRANTAVSLLFTYDGTGTLGTSASLLLTSGLPIGTMLTLVDLSGTVPQYYYYTVNDDGVKEIALTEFTKMGTTTENFAGVSTKMLIDIGYSNTTHSQAGESVTMSVGGEEIGAACSYSFASAETEVSSIGSVTLNYTQALYGNLYAPALSDKYYDSDDRVLFTVRLQDETGAYVNLPAGLECSINGTPLAFYSDYSIAYIGNVSSFTSSISAYGEIALDYFKYLNFSGTLVYEMIVVPREYVDTSADSYDDLANINGCYASVAARQTLNITVIDAPAISVGVSKDTLAPGEEFELSLSVQEQGQVSYSDNVICTAYIYQMVDGKLVYTEWCESLLNVGDIGNQSFESGVKFEVGTPGGSMPISVSPLVNDAGETQVMEGEYYLVLYVGSNSSVVRIQIVEEQTSEAPTA